MACHSFHGCAHFTDWPSGVISLVSLTLPVGLTKSVGVCVCGGGGVNSASCVRTTDGIGGKSLVLMSHFLMGLFSLGEEGQPASPPKYNLLLVQRSNSSWKVPLPRKPPTQDRGCLLCPPCWLLARQCHPATTHPIIPSTQGCSLPRGGLCLGEESRPF